MKVEVDLMQVAHSIWYKEVKDLDVKERLTQWGDCMSVVMLALICYCNRIVWRLKPQVAVGSGNAVLNVKLTNHVPTNRHIEGNVLQELPSIASVILRQLLFPVIWFEHVNHDTLCVCSGSCAFFWCHCTANDPQQQSGNTLHHHISSFTVASGKH